MLCLRALSNILVVAKKTDDGDKSTRSEANKGTRAKGTSSHCQGATGINVGENGMVETCSSNGRGGSNGKLGKAVRKGLDPGTEVQPTSLTVGEAKSEVIDFLGDEDWYEVELHGGEPYAISLNGVAIEERGTLPLADPYLRGIYLRGEKLGENDDASEKNSLVVFVTPETEVYQIKVGGYGRAIGGYKIEARMPTQEDQDFFDATNSTRKPKVLRLGVSEEGTIEKPNDKNWYVIDLKGHRKYRIQVEPRAANETSISFALAIHNSDGKPLWGSVRKNKENEKYKKYGKYGNKYKQNASLATTILENSTIEEFVTTQNGVHYLGVSSVGAKYGSYTIYIEELTHNVAKNP